MCIHIRKPDDKSILQCVYEERLIVCHLPTNICCEADQCSFHYLILWYYLDHSLFFLTLVVFRRGQSKLYWNGSSASILMPFDWNHSCISAYKQWLFPCSANILDDISTIRSIYALGAPISVKQFSSIRTLPSSLLWPFPSLAKLHHGTLMLLSLIMWVITATISFSKVF